MEKQKPATPDDIEACYEMCLQSFQRVIESCVAKGEMPVMIVCEKINEPGEFVNYSALPTNMIRGGEKAFKELCEDMGFMS